jgi:hypothetical protein
LTPTCPTPNPTSTTGIQQVLKPINYNIPFGDSLSSPKLDNTIRILFQNVNGVQKGKSWNELSSFSKKARQFSVDIFGAAETNINWNFLRNLQAKSVLSKYGGNFSITTSSNIEETLSAYQPGGTLTAIFNKYTDRSHSTIQDPTSLGRWSGFKLNTNLGHHLNTITVYQSTKADGIHTTYQQKTHFFRNKGIHNPEPRKLLLTDLENVIKEYNLRKEETVILIDANDGFVLTRLPSSIVSSQHKPTLTNLKHTTSSTNAFRGITLHRFNYRQHETTRSYSSGWDI